MWLYRSGPFPVGNPRSQVSGAPATGPLRTPRLRVLHPWLCAHRLAAPRDRRGRPRPARTDGCQGPQRLRGQGRRRAVAQRSRQRPLRPEGRPHTVRGKARRSRCQWRRSRLRCCSRRLSTTPEVGVCPGRGRCSYSRGSASPPYRLAWLGGGVGRISSGCRAATLVAAQRLLNGFRCAVGSSLRSVLGRVGGGI